MKVEWIYLTESTELEPKTEYWTLERDRGGAVTIAHERTDKYGEFETNDSFKENIISWEVIAVAKMEKPELP